MSGTQDPSPPPNALDAPLVSVVEKPQTRGYVETGAGTRAADTTDEGWDSASEAPAPPREEAPQLAYEGPSLDAVPAPKAKSPSKVSGRRNLFAKAKKTQPARQPKAQKASNQKNKPPAPTRPRPAPQPAAPAPPNAPRSPAASDALVSFGAPDPSARIEPKAFKQSPAISKVAPPVLPPPSIAPPISTVKAPVLPTADAIAPPSSAPPKLYHDVPASQRPAVIGASPTATPAPAERSTVSHSIGAPQLALLVLVLLLCSAGAAAIITYKPPLDPNVAPSLLPDEADQEGVKVRRTLRGTPKLPPKRTPRRKAPPPRPTEP